MTLRPLKRVYKEVTVGRVEGVPAVLLDGRPLQTPAKAPLLLPNEALAAAVAEEWRDQGEEIQPNDMPLTRIAVSVVDRVAPARDEIVEQVATFGGTDLLCYRSEHADLAARQAEKWQPILDWAERALAASLVIVDGVMPVAQEDRALAALRRAVDGHSDVELAALYLATTTTGSLILALALSHGEVDARMAWELGRLDEVWQAERWGEDPEATERGDQMRLEMCAVARFLELCRAA